jgi:dipeptidyl aminopeptidase/acylaminoacyl peptidase
MDLASKQTRMLTQDIPWDVEQFEVSWDGMKIALVANEDGLSTLHLLDAATGKPLTAPKLPPGLIGDLHWHRNNRDLAFSLTSARNPTDCYSVDVTTNKVERWTTSETAVHTDAFADAELIRWKSFDGKSISGFLYRPPAKFTGKRPVMIDVHGGRKDRAVRIFSDVATTI